MASCRRVALAALTAAVLLPPWPVPVRAASPAPRPLRQESQPPATTPNELDAFMARVLERRDETWRKLHDYVLDEAEQFRIYGPGGVPLHGLKREYTWYVREGFLIRSPLRYDGVTLSDAERRSYEQRWLQQEKSREERAAKAEAAKTHGGQSEGASDATSATAGTASPSGSASGTEAPGGASAGGEASLEDFVGQRGEPRFISEAYFLRFKFEPGNYYFAGRDTIDGRPVVKIEYYPTRLFDTARDGNRKAAEAGTDERGHRRPRRERERDRAKEDEYGRKFNKVALVTLWIDPADHQIVRYTFDNMDFGFLPGRWLVRLDEARAAMTMARVLDGVWLPREITMRAALSLANGSYEFDYARQFSSYKKAETGARIRSMVPR